MVQQLFDDDGNVIKSIMLVSGRLFFYAGQLMANSLLQGGPNPGFLSDWCYKFISSSKKCLLPTDFDILCQFMERTDIKKV